MKGIKKYLFIMAALAAVFGFAACGEKDDDPSTVAVYEAEDEAMTLTFFDNDTWAVAGKVLGNVITAAAGTYTGDPAKNGKISITFTKMVDYDTGKLTDIPLAQQEAETVSITNGKMVVNHTTFTRQ